MWIKSGVIAEWMTEFIESLWSKIYSEEMFNLISKLRYGVKFTSKRSLLSETLELGVNSNLNKICDHSASTYVFLQSRSCISFLNFYDDNNLCQ